MVIGIYIAFLSAYVGNDQFYSGKITESEALKWCTNIKKRLTNDSPIIFNNENQKILEVYLKDYFNLK